MTNANGTIIALSRYGVTPSQERSASDGGRTRKELIQTIKDSGDRTEFSTGAVRDMHGGKGRFDLLPWAAIWEVAKHCESGAVKYGLNNVRKGIPYSSLLDSTIRHLVKFFQGMTDEPHLTAACWNALWLLEQTITHPELNDLYYWNGGESK